MVSQATFKHIRKTPRKMRIVADLVRGLQVEKALDLLRFQRKVAAVDVSKLIRSAVANAMQKGGVRPDSLYVKTIMVNVAPTFKRFTPRARGSSAKILKRNSHITVVLDSRI